MPGHPGPPGLPGPGAGGQGARGWLGSGLHLQQPRGHRGAGLWRGPVSLAERPAVSQAGLGLPGTDVQWQSGVGLEVQLRLCEGHCVDRGSGRGALGAEQMGWEPGQTASGPGQAKPARGAEAFVLQMHGMGLHLPGGSVGGLTPRVSAAPSSFIPPVSESET